MTSADGPRTDVSDITTFTYDSHGNLSTRTDALGHVTRYTGFDASGRPLSWVDPNGLQTTLTYDLRGRMLTSTVGAETTRYAYDATGNLLKTTFTDGSYLKYSYDPANRLIGLTDALGNSLVYTLDAMGNRVKEQTNDPNQTLTRTLSRSYDALNRLAQTIGAQNQTTAYGYDDNDNPASVTDPLANINQTQYDSRNRPVTTIAPNSTYTYYAYDGNSQLTAVTDPKYNQTSYVYDGLGNKTQQTSPDTGVTTYTYDAAGNVITSTDARGVQTLYAYDALNRLIKKSFTPNSSYGDISSATYQYDQGTYGIGHLTGMTDTSGATTWLYEIHGRLVQQQQTIGLVTLTTHYQYDAAGRLSQLTTPSNNTIAYQYNANGQVNAVTVGGTVLFNSVHYQPFGAISSWVWGNGTAYSRSYDLDGRLTTLPLGTDNRSYTYDADSRITAAASDGSVQSVSPSFITPANAGSTYYTINYSNNSLTQITAYASGTTLNLGYDAVGNLSSDSVNNYQYDLGGRLMSVGSASFQMNGQGKRVSKTSLTSGTRYFAYDQAGHLLGEYNTQGLAIQETIWLGNTPVGTVSAGTGLLYVYADHLNTPRTVTTQSNRVIWSWVSDPFGNGVPITSNDDSGNPYQFNLRFPGQYYDQETGLHYNMARYYNPAIGRYTQSDPIGLGGGVNTYNYTYNNAVNLVDFSGLDTIIQIGYTQTPGFSVTGAYHEVVILTDTVTGQSYATRAGPESQGVLSSASNSSLSVSGGSISASAGDGGSGGIGFGQIYAQSGVYDATFRDYPNVVSVQTVGTINQDFNVSVMDAIEFANVTNNNQIPYIPSGPNSNSYATTFVQSLTGIRPNPTLLAPGTSFGEPDPSLSYSPASLSNCQR